MGKKMAHMILIKTFNVLRVELDNLKYKGLTYSVNIKLR